MKLARRRVLLAALPLCCALASPSAQGRYRDVHPTRVWTVNAMGGGDFFDLPRAVDTADAGDVLLVAPGDYSAFELRGKGLTILGDGGVPRVNGSTLVKGLPTNQAVCLRSLELKHSSGSFALPALRLQDDEGTVWIEDCTIHRQTPLFASSLDDAALLAVDCADVMLVRSQVVGSLTNVFPFMPPTGAGLYALRSDVHAFETVFQGVNVAQGLTGGSGIPNLGGNGATLVDSSLYAAGSTFRGGQGQSAYFNGFGGFCSSIGQRGGAGLEAGLAASVPVTLACTLQGGPGGNNAPPFCPGGTVGPATIGMVRQEPLPLRSYELESPVRGRTSYQLSASCEPGEFVWSVFAESLEPLYVPNYFGTQVGALPVTLVFEGVANGSGSLTKSMPIPPLAALTSFERLFAQGLFFDALNNAYLGSPSVLVVVD